MNPKDKINKAAWGLLEASKDIVSANVTMAIRSGQIKVESASAQTLLALINASLEEGYHKAHKSFAKSVDSALADVQMPPLVAAPSKKKPQRDG